MPGHGLSDDELAKGATLFTGAPPMWLSLPEGYFDSGPEFGKE
jgi:hypothetical protein